LGKIDELKQKSVAAAASKNWKFDEYQGDLCLIEKLLDGEWNKEDFLILNPGEKITPSYDDDIITAVEM
jgi:hypothetical protein